MSLRQLNLTSRRDFSRLLGTALVTGPALGSLTGCSKPGAGVKIGLAAELTGEIPAVGLSCKQGAELAVSEINKAGGLEVAGMKHPITLVILDTQGTADGAVMAIRKLGDQEKCLAIVGPNSSTGAVPAAGIAEASKVIMITPWSTNPQTTVYANTGNPRKWVFRACFTDPFEGKVLSKFAREYLRVSKAAVLYEENAAAPKSQAAIFQQDFTAGGGQIVAFEKYSEGEKDVRAQFTRIKEAGPDLIFLPSYYNEVAGQLAQARDLGITVPVLGSDNWSSPEWIAQAGPNAEGVFFCNHYSAGSRAPKTDSFVDRFRKRFDSATPDDVAALTYDAFGLLAQAVKTSTKLEREEVRDALARIGTYEGATGKMTFRGTGDPEKSAVIFKVEGGKPVFVTSVEP